MQEEDIRRGPLVSLQEACQQMVKDKRFSKVLNALKTYPGYRLNVYIQEWQELEKRNIDLGTFWKDGFFPTDLKTRKETDPGSGSVQKPLTRRKFQAVSEEIAEALSKSFWDHDFEDFWGSEEENPSTTEPAQEGETDKSDEMSWEDRMERLAAKLKELPKPSKFTVLTGGKEQLKPAESQELGFKKARRILGDYEGERLVTGVSGASYGWYIYFEGGCLGTGKGEFHSQDIWGFDCDQDDVLTFKSKPILDELDTNLKNLEEKLWFQQLRPAPKKTVKSAEALYDLFNQEQRPDSYDLSPIVVLYCKSIELAFDTIYRRFREDIHTLADRLPHRKQFSELIKQLKYIKTKQIGDPRKWEEWKVGFKHFHTILKTLGAGTDLPPPLKGFLPEKAREFVQRNNSTLRDLKEVFRKRNSFAHTGIIDSGDRNALNAVEVVRSRAQRVLIFLTHLIQNCA